MALLDALTTTEYNKLRATSGTTSYAAAQYVSLCPNTVIQATTIASAPSSSITAQVTLSATADSDIAIGMTVLISETNDKSKAYFRGYVRKAPSGTTLYINATSKDIDAGDYIWVIDDYDIHPKMARDTGTAYYKDYDEAYRAPKPVIYGLQSSYAGIVSSSVLELVLSPNAFAVNADATGAITWSWDVGDGTITSGTSTSREITVTFPAGFRWVHVTATDSASQSRTFHFQVHAHDWTTYPPETKFSGAEIHGDVQTGWEASISAWSGVDDILDRTAITLWSRENYNGTATSLYGDTGNVDFVGRFRSEQNESLGHEIYAIVNSVSFEIEGPALQLARIDAQPLALQNDTSPTAWDEIDTLTVWRAIAYYLDTHTTYLTVCGLTIDDTTDAFHQPLLGTPDTSALEVINDLALRINAAIEFAPDGRSQVVRSARYLASSDRSALTTIANLTTSDAMTLNVDVAHVGTVGRVEASGGVYNTSADTVTPMLSFAPGIMQEEPSGIVQLPRQVLDSTLSITAAQAELNFRSGQHYIAAGEHDTLTVDFLPGYASLLIPGNAHLYTFTVGSTNNLRGRSYDTSDYWLLVDVSIQHDNAIGTKAISATFERLEAVAPSGQTIQYPANGELTYALPSLPTFNIYDFLPDPPDLWLDPDAVDIPPFSDEPPTGQYVSPADGNTVLGWDASTLALSTDFIKTPCQWRVITPTSGTVKHALFDTHNLSAAYCLIYDGSTNSHVYYTENVFAATPSWTQGGGIAGEWNSMRLTDTAGELYINRAEGTETTSVVSAGSTNDGNGTNTGVAITSGENIDMTATGTWSYGIPAETYQTGPDGLAVTAGAGFRLPGANKWSLVGRIGTSGSWFEIGSSSSFIATASGTLYLGINDDAYTDNEGSLSVTVTQSAGGASDYHYVAYSDDYGATLSSETAGTSIDDDQGGFDTPTEGNAVLAGIAGYVKTATDDGAFSNETNGVLTGSGASLIVIPRVKFDGTAANTAAAPEYLLGANSGVYGPDQTLWKVTSGGKTDITPADGGTNGIPFARNGGAVCWSDPDRIAVIVSIGGTTIKLATSTDGGSTWSFSRALAASTNYVRMRRNDTTGLQVFIAERDTGALYIADFDTTFVTKNWVNSNPMLGIEVYG